MAAVLLSSGVAFAFLQDFGLGVAHKLEAQSMKYFGFVQPIERTATDEDVIERAVANAADRQFLAKGLKAEFVARNVAYKADMIAFWPDDIDYTHLIVCNEDGRNGTTPAGNGGLNSSVQRIDVKSGEVVTILYGMDRCDGIRTTQWGTVLATEETGDGAGYEIIDPLATDEHWIADRGSAGVAADIRAGIDSPTLSANIVKRTALVTQAWEGLEALDNGVVIGGDELRPGFDNDGGAIFRFVPETLFDCQGAPVRPGLLCENTISELSQSPLAAGKNYALATVCTGSDDYGQGCQAGRGLWVEVNAATARADAQERGATGYCRPEDLHVDRSYGAYAGAEGIRWCWTNTCGNGRGEVICVYEDAADANQEVFEEDFGYPLLANADGSFAEADVRPFNIGDDRMRNHDNLDIQPFTSNVYVIEDAQFGEIWACLQDGDDRDFYTDGCVAMLSVRDPSAEPSGFIFDGTGKTAFYHLQHGQQAPDLMDWDSNKLDGRTDDLVKISGFKL